LTFNQLVAGSNPARPTISILNQVKLSRLVKPRQAGCRFRPKAKFVEFKSCTTHHLNTQSSKTQSVSKTSTSWLQVQAEG
ncbi:hypothetical protein, partial [Providencia sp.]|uniref:hypothetical protein n=1 Tax=Providencia sp. TaxID=589 RepID=UPI0035B1389D